MIRSYLETYPIVTYKPIRRNDMKQSDTYKEIAPAYQIKAFHRPGNVIVCVGFAHRHPQIFSQRIYTNLRNGPGGRKIRGILRIRGEFPHLFYKVKDPRR